MKGECWRIKSVLQPSLSDLTLFLLSWIFILGKGFRDIVIRKIHFFLAVLLLKVWMWTTCCVNIETAFRGHAAVDHSIAEEVSLQDLSTILLMQVVLQI